jgi:diaminopimelate epimerase
VIFYKTSSFGNDFIAVAGEALPQGMAKGDLAKAICDRQLGVGADGVVYYARQDRALRFEIYNRDGGAAELSGNGMAGLAAVLLQRRLAVSPLVLQAGVGSRRVVLLERLGSVFCLDVEIGKPDFAARSFFPFLDGRRGPYEAAGVEFHPVSVGNPHAVVVCRKLPAAARLAGLGKKLEGQPLFPKRVNVEFVQALDAESCRVYFYERGVGPTRASSTGSAAVFAVMRRLGMAGDQLRIEHEPEPIRLSWRTVRSPSPQGDWQDGIHIRIVTRLVCRGEYFR